MFDVDWGDLDESLIIWEITGKWSTSVLEQAIHKTFEMMRSKQHAVELIVDARRAHGIPQGAMRLLCVFFKQHPDNLHTVAWICMSSLWKTMWEMAERSYGVSEVNVVFVNTVDEAYQAVEPHART